MMKIERVDKEYAAKSSQSATIARRQRTFRNRYLHMTEMEMMMMMMNWQDAKVEFLLAEECIKSARPSARGKVQLTRLLFLSLSIDPSLILWSSALICRFFNETLQNMPRDKCHHRAPINCTLHHYRGHDGGKGTANSSLLYSAKNTLPIFCRLFPCSIFALVLSLALDLENRTKTRWSIILIKQPQQLSLRI